MINIYYYFKPICMIEFGGKYKNINRQYTNSYAKQGHQDNDFKFRNYVL